MLEPVAGGSLLWIPGAPRIEVWVSNAVDNDAQDVRESEMFGNRSLLNPEWPRGHQTTVLYTESDIELWWMLTILR